MHELSGGKSAMKRHDGMTSGEFIAAGAGIAGVGALSGRASARSRDLGGRGVPMPAVQGSSKARVVLVKTESRAEGVKKCLDLLNIDPFRGKRVLIKPNFNTSDPPPGSPHNDTLSALLGRLRDMGGKGLAVGARR